MSIRPKVVIYTDGANKAKVGAGGYAALMICGRWMHAIDGRVEGTTNNRMELLAVVHAIALLQVPCEIEVISDSQYVVGGINRYLKNWLKNGWKTKTRKNVIHQDLWKLIADFKNQHSIIARWVKGHDQNEGNQYADWLAQQACYA